MIAPAPTCQVARARYFKTHVLGDAEQQPDGDGQHKQAGAGVLVTGMGEEERVAALVAELAKTTQMLDAATNALSTEKALSASMQSLFEGANAKMVQASHLSSFLNASRVSAEKDDGADDGLASGVAAVVDAVEEDGERADERGREAIVSGGGAGGYHQPAVADAQTQCDPDDQDGGKGDAKTLPSVKHAARKSHESNSTQTVDYQSMVARAQKAFAAGNTPDSSTCLRVDGLFTV
jgi:hypothetical protein